MKVRDVQTGEELEIGVWIEVATGKRWTPEEVEFIFEEVRCE